MQKKTILVLTTVFLSLIILLIGGEILARLLFRFDHVSLKDEINLTYQYDEELGWFPIPASSKTFKGTRRIQVKHNRDGFRDIDHGAKTRKRIMFIGDSFVWGYDVNYGERFSEHLQHRMPDWEIINMGISGYSTDQELMLLKKWFDVYHPDVVFLVVCDNDIVGNRTNKIHGYFKPYFTLVNGSLVERGIPVPRNIRNYIVEYPWIVYSRMLVYVILRASPKRITGDDITNDLFNEMQNYIRSKGGDFYIAFTDDKGEGKTCDHCHTDSIPYLLLTTDLRYDQNGFHWTPEGNKFVSDKIYDFLIEQGVLSN